jgi:hypothetical protein
MRKLLILAAGATLLAAPAFAQSGAGSSTATDPTQAGQSNTVPSADQGGTLGPSSVQPSPNADASSPGYDNNQPANKTPNANGDMQNGTSTITDPGASNGSSGDMQSGTATSGDSGMTNGTSGTRMYSATGGNGDVQIVSNGPIPDTAANRAKYRPLSHAGRNTKAAGN